MALSALRGGVLGVLFILFLVAALAALVERVLRLGSLGVHAVAGGALHRSLAFFEGVVAGLAGDLEGLGVLLMGEGDVAGLGVQHHLFRGGRPQTACENQDERDTGGQRENSFH